MRQIISSIQPEVQLNPKTSAKTINYKQQQTLHYSKVWMELDSEIFFWKILRKAELAPGSEEFRAAACVKYKYEYE